MNILLLYTTNSGGTEMVTNEISQRLSGHTVNIKRILDTNADEIKAHDFIILGTPSWDFEGREGQPHEDWFTFKKNLQGNPFEGKKCAVFGLGDSSYKIFCGGVSELEKWAEEWKMQRVTDSLRIDKYFYKQSEAMEAIERWCRKLMEVLK
jgi:flavodoxin I